MSGGTVPADTLAVLVKERNYMPMTSSYESSDRGERWMPMRSTKDPQSVDLICDKYCYAGYQRDGRMLPAAQFVRGYVRLLIDTINLKTFARARRMNQPWSFFGDCIYSGRQY